MTNLLKGENGSVSMSKKKYRKTQDRRKAKKHFSFVMLSYPDFHKPFRSLKDIEASYATNERELFAILWALGKLQHYLYGGRDIHIYTDYQPLTFAVSDSSPNTKIKSWKAYIDEHNVKVHYKLGKEHHVADALSRQDINALSNDIMRRGYHPQ